MGLNRSPEPPLPEIIQGGMGVYVSNHRLARTVAIAGGLGVVSGTGLDGVYARLLQDGDRGARWGIERLPDEELAERLLGRYFKAAGREGKPYKNPPKWIIDPRTERQRANLAHLQELAVVSAFAEVTRAKHGHDGPIGINVLRKIAMPIPATLYGAILAGVDFVLAGAGSPDELPPLLDLLASHQAGELSVKVLRATDGVEHATRFAPAQLQGMPTDAPLRRPRFLAIVASVDLATGLAAEPAICPDGFIVEGPTAGGHNAPPRGPWRPQTNPAYDTRDQVDVAAIAAIGLPFWLAGSYGSPEGLIAARRAGACGVQAGTVFALCRESGLTPELKHQILRKLADGSLRVTTRWQRLAHRLSVQGSRARGHAFRPRHPRRSRTQVRSGLPSPARGPERRADLYLPGRARADLQEQGGQRATNQWPRVSVQRAVRSGRVRHSNAWTGTWSPRSSPAAPTSIRCVISHRTGMTTRRPTRCRSSAMARPASRRPFPRQAVGGPVADNLRHFHRRCARCTGAQQHVLLAWALGSHSGRDTHTRSGSA